MHSQSLTAKRIFLNAGLVIVSTLVFAAGAFAGAQDPSERQRALDLFEANNLVAALPLLEKVAAATPNDPVMNDNGLLKPYILFARPDQGITLDYAAYRKANREKLRRYWLEVAIGIK
jgi:hypothetical protein